MGPSDPKPKRPDDDEAQPSKPESGGTEPIGPDEPSAPADDADGSSPSRGPDVLPGDPRGPDLQAS